MDKSLFADVCFVKTFLERSFSKIAVLSSVIEFLLDGLWSFFKVSLGVSLLSSRGVIELFLGAFDFRESFLEVNFFGTLSASMSQTVF